MKLKHVVSFQMDVDTRSWTKDSNFYYGSLNRLYFPSVPDMDSQFYLTPMCNKLNKGEKIYVSSGDLLALDLESDALYEYITTKFETDLSNRSTHAYLTHYMTFDNEGVVVIFGDNIYMDENALKYLEETMDENEFQSIKDNLLAKFGDNYYMYK